jgi:hypothetical protein
MKASRLFLAWLASTATVAALSSGGYHLYRSAAPRRILIVVDASYPMQEAWSEVPESIATIAARKRGSYAVVTDKGGLVHGFRPVPDLGRTVPYGPRDLDGLSGRLPQEAKDADEIVLITNASAAEAQRSGIREIEPVGERR